MTKKTVLAVIPARKGSKRIPGKNTKLFNNKPLIEWTIEAALSCPQITEIIVTTDDEQILAMKEKFPEINFLRRPDSLCEDSTPGITPVLHAMQNAVGSHDTVLLLQPTSPLRTDRHITEALECFAEAKAEKLISARLCSDNLNHVVIESETGLKLLIKDTPFAKKAWVVNGAIYLAKWQSFVRDQNFIDSNTIVYEMPVRFSIDIDTNEDWAAALEAANGNITNG